MSSKGLIYDVVYVLVMTAGIIAILGGYALLCCALSWLLCLIAGAEWSWTIGLATTGVVVIMRLLLGGGRR